MRDVLFTKRLDTRANSTTVNGSIYTVVIPIVVVLVYTDSVHEVYMCLLNASAAQCMYERLCNHILKSDVVVYKLDHSCHSITKH
jgi:hypothetical protein